MEVNVQFHALASVQLGKATVYPQSRSLDLPLGGQDDLDKNKISRTYQNRNPDLPARRINSVLSFIIIVIIYFMLTGLDLKVLTLNDERYKVCEEKEPVIKVQEKINLIR